MQNEKSKFKKEFILRLIKFTLQILHFAEDLRKNRNLWAIADQLIRSAGSVGANVVEAKGSASKKDYTRFFEIALKSANETKYWLIVIREYDKINYTKAKEFLTEADEIAKVIGSSILTLKGKKSF